MSELFNMAVKVVQKTNRKILKPMKTCYTTGSHASTGCGFLGSQPKKHATWDGKTTVCGHKVGGICGTDSERLDFKLNDIGNCKHCERIFKSIFGGSR